VFVADTLTVWIEALKAVTLHPQYDSDSPLREIAVHANYPVAEVDYPGIWVNYSMQGDLKNVGIGHVESVIDEEGGLHEVGRWHFGGMVEFTIAGMSNLERALLIDAFTRVLAIGRIDKNPEGELRRHIEESDLIGQSVTWDSFTVGAFAESQGTPWGTDDVIYEATVSLTTSGEVVVDPDTGSLVRLGSILTDVVVDGTASMPVPGNDGWM
jgi:hypothetical protein